MTYSDDKLSSVVVDTGFAGKVAQLGQKEENCQFLSVVEHKPMKTGTQRFRWNLLFNVLVWLIVPLPLWMPYIDNDVALYLIPSLQTVFVLMWVVIVGLATRTMVTLYR